MLDEVLDEGDLNHYRIANNRQQIEELVGSFIGASADVLARNGASQHFIDAVVEAASTLHEALGQGRLVMTCGNGGSMAEASHFAAELSGRFDRTRKPFAALALSDPGFITCVANDFGFENLFARGVEALGRSGDVLVCFSTSGQSENVVRAAQAARSMGLKVVGFTGVEKRGLSEHCDVAIGVDPPASTAQVQQVHQVAMHSICAYLDSLVHL